MAYVYKGKQPAFVIRPDGSKFRLTPCGSDSAYKRHLRNKEIACNPCLVAHADKHRNEYRKKAA